MTSNDADTKTPPPPAGEKQDGKQDQVDGPTMADVRKLVSEEIHAALEPFKSLLGGGGGNSDDKTGDKDKGPADNPAAGDIDSMIDRAITKVLGDKEKAASEDQHAKEHERIKAATAERPPVSRPRRAKWLGNIYDNN